MTADELPRLLDEWQQRLGLRDWRVSVRAGNPHAMGRDGVTGSVEYDICDRAARITVLCDDDVPGLNLIAPHDAEQVLCHEVLHLLCIPFQPEDDKSPGGIALEQAINAVAWALVALKRETSAPSTESSKTRGNDERD